jgi:hypothetical protein
MISPFRENPDRYHYSSVDCNLQVALSSHESFALQESNFLFTVPRTDSSKLDRESFELKKVQISVVSVVLAFLLCIFWSIFWKKYDEEFLLVNV